MAARQCSAAGTCRTSPILYVAAFTTAKIVFRWETLDTKASQSPTHSLSPSPNFRLHSNDSSTHFPGRGGELRYCPAEGAFSVPWPGPAGESPSTALISAQPVFQSIFLVWRGPSVTPSLSLRGFRTNSSPRHPWGAPAAPGALEA